MPTEPLVVEARLRDELSGPLKHVAEEVAVVGEEVNHTGKKAGRLSGAFGTLAKSGSKTAAMLGRTLKRAAHLGAMALLAVAVAVVVLGKKFVGLASSAKETETKFAKVFGQNTRTVQKWVTATSNAYGRTTKSLQDATAKFAVFGKAAGISADKLPKFSTRLTQAGLDLASFYNKDSSEVFDALSSGLAGMTRPLRQYGIFLSKAKMEAQAMAMGLDPKKLTDGQAVMVRQALIIKQLGDANGDLARTHDSLANRTRAFKGRLEELQTQIGVGLMPVAGALIGFLERRMAPIMAKLTKDGPKFAAAWSDVFRFGDWHKLAVLVDDVMGGKGKHVAGIEKRGAALSKFLKRVPSMLHHIGTVIGSVFGTLVRWGGYLYTIWTDGVAPAFSDLGGSAAGAKPGLDAVSSVLKFIADHAKTLRPLIGALTAGWLAYKVASLAAAGAQAVMNLATEANPYVLLATAMVAVVYLLVRLYKHNQKFAHAVDTLGRGIRSAFGWILHHWKDIAAAMLGPVGVIIILYRHVKLVRTVLNAIGRTTLGGLKHALKWVDDRLGNIASIAGKVGRFLHIGRGPTSAGRSLGAVGDTRRPHGGGRGSRRAAANLAHTLAVHRAADAATPGRRRITSSIRNYALGSPSSDHTTGRALDVVGPNLNAYAANIRAAGGYAEHHGTGAGRHLHAAIGDTARPMASSGHASGGGDSQTVITFAAGSIVVMEPASNVDVARAVADGIKLYDRDRRERRIPRG